MKKIKALLAVLLACCILFASTGCIIQLNTEKNNNIVLATIDGTHDILKKDYLPLFSYYAMMYEYYEMEITNEIRDQCLDTLIREKVYELEMDAIEFNVNDEDLKKAREDYDKELQELADSYKENDKEEDSERDYMQEAKDYYAEYFEDNDTTEEEYINDIAQTYRFERYKKYLITDANIKDDAILARYNELKSKQTQSPDLDADILIYTPSGVEYKYFTVSLTTEQKAEYEKLIGDGKTEEAEKYAKEKGLANVEKFVKMLDTKSFETVINEANEYLKTNCGVDEADLIKSDEMQKHYKYTNSTTGIKGELDAKLLSLATGTTTEALYTEKGTYVVAKCYGRFASETVPYEIGSDVYNDIKEALETEYIEKKWEEKSDSIMNKHKIEIFKGRYHNKNY